MSENVGALVSETCERYWTVGKISKININLRVVRDFPVAHAQLPHSLFV
jgi:hypothetical protein